MDCVKPHLNKTDLNAHHPLILDLELNAVSAYELGLWKKLLEHCGFIWKSCNVRKHIWNNLYEEKECIWDGGEDMYLLVVVFSLESLSYFIW